MDNYGFSVEESPTGDIILYKHDIPVEGPFKDWAWAYAEKSLHILRIEQGEECPETGAVL